MTPTERRRSACPRTAPARVPAATGEIMIWLAVAAGGALGSMARHGVNIVFAHVLERAVPHATAAVNLAGSLAIGLLSGAVASGRLHLSPEMRTFVFVGILGGFTTFSSFFLDPFPPGAGGEHTTPRRP